MRIFSNIYSGFLSLISKLFLLFEFFLFLRLLLKFLNANPQTVVVNLIYKYSDILVSPFDFIFKNIYWGKYLIEMSTISAMAGYALLAFILFKILRFFSRS